MAKLVYEELTYLIIGAAMEVHKIFGNGLLEAVYQKALEHELRLQNISQVGLLINFGAKSLEHRRVVNTKSEKSV
jgi:hypothetical protein